MTTHFLQRLSLRPNADLPEGVFPATLPFVRDLDLRFENPVTFFVGENGSGKSTLIEAIAELCGLPVGGGGRNELSGLRAPHNRSELAPFLRAAFRKKPRHGYFFRAEFQTHIATLLEERDADPDFDGDAYHHYGGRSLHTRSHGEAFLAMFILERACRIQILAQSGGSDLKNIGDPILDKVAMQLRVVTMGQGAGLAWPGLLRKLDKIDSSYSN